MKIKAIVVIVLVLFLVIEYAYQFNMLLDLPEEISLEELNPEKTQVALSSASAIPGVRTYIRKLNAFRPTPKNPFLQPGENVSDKDKAPDGGSTLKAIIIGPSVRVALFGNAIYTVGDSVGTSKIADIKPDHVILVDGSGSQTKLVPNP